MTTRRKPPKKVESFAAGVGRGLRRAARTAREVARMHGTPIYIWENGKVVAKDPNTD
jgi:hypothetical protein